jgi:hypothetical protein
MKQRNIINYELMKQQYMVSFLFLITKYQRNRCQKLLEND